MAHLLPPAGTASSRVRLPHPHQRPEDRAWRCGDGARHPGEPGPCRPAKRALCSVAGKSLCTRPSAQACCTYPPFLQYLEGELGTFRPESALQGADPAAINAELLAKNDEVVPLLLAFLKDGPQAASNFYVRYHTVQLLTALAAGGPYRLQRVRDLTSCHGLRSDTSGHISCACGYLSTWQSVTVRVVYSVSMPAPSVGSLP